MTEGILIREMMSDPLLQSYSAIMLDEVHERTLYTDILMGLMKKILKKRKELRLIVASATMDARALQSFFNLNETVDAKKDTAVILSVHGRQFPVDIFYLKGNFNSLSMEFKYISIMTFRSGTMLCSSCG